MSKKPFAFQTLSERFADVRHRVAAAARRAHRSPDEVALIAISKTHPVETLRDGLKAGITDFGENRRQEAEEKILAMGRTTARWQLGGNLQTNKRGGALKLFDSIH